MDDHGLEDSTNSEHPVDRLSQLPHSLVLLILSFLPMRDAVRTTLLSNHWKNLWTTLPYLNFVDIRYEDEDPNAHRLRNFFNRVLKFWRGTRILKFIIDVDYLIAASVASDMDLWVRFAVENKVDELSINLVDTDELNWFNESMTVDDTKDIYCAPVCLNSCSFITKLSLGCNIQIHGSPVWTRLKSLSIDCFFLSEQSINNILLGSPHLEVFNLSLMEGNENLNIQSTSLKDLKIQKYVFMGEGLPSMDTGLRICCPNLRALEILGILYSKCVFTDVSSLTDVSLLLSDYDGDWIPLLGQMMRQILPSIHRVEKLTLSDHCAQVLLENKYILPTLPNVKFLRLTLESFEFSEVMHLLGMFPNIKILIFDARTYGYPLEIDSIKYLNVETSHSNSSLFQHLKTVEITSSFSSISILQLVAFLLKHCGMLEKFVIFADSCISPYPANLLKVAQKLLSMPRSSPTANIIFEHETWSSLHN